MIKVALISSCLVCKNIIPTLSLAEMCRRGYIDCFVHLALSSRMVLSSLLAASASHIQITHFRELAVHRFKYRSITFANLQQASIQREPGPTLPLLAVSAILGLLIDFNIAGTGELPALFHTAQFWVRINHNHSRGLREKTKLCFLLDQIQICILQLLDIVSQCSYIEIDAYYS